jgi:tripartite ATP-independent transporter DctM subunit
MFDAWQMATLIIVLLAIVFSGVHIAVALGITAALGIYLMQGDIEVVRIFIANTAYEALRDYIFAVIPLFMLMGEFLAKCGAATDLFALINRLMRRVPGRLGIATVFANAVFAFVTGVSIAAAAAFSRIAWPEMKRHGYERKFALGCIAGSACLGMLIPPSVLMIVWGVLTEQAIGKLFVAGIIPGFLVVVAYSTYILFVAVTQPERVGERRKVPHPAGAAAAPPPAVGDDGGVLDDAQMRAALISTLFVIALIVGVLGGI